jgi:endonuclease III
MQDMKKRSEIRDQKSEITYALDVMQEMFADYPTTELIYHTPFQLLISVMLSAQTTDKQVNKVTEQFYDTIRTPQDICSMREEELYGLIKGVNYSKTKAKHIYETARLLITSSQYSVTGSVSDTYTIPNTLSELIKLPGV